MEQFEKAVALTGSEFDDMLGYYAEKWLPARAHVERALDEATRVHPSGRFFSSRRFVRGRSTCTNSRPSER